MTYNSQISKTFCEIITEHASAKGYKQKDLVKLSGRDKSTISRIYNNTNNKGRSYCPTPDTVVALCIGLGLDPDEARVAWLAAYPEMVIWLHALENKWDIDKTNEVLYENGYPMLTGNNDE